MWRIADNRIQCKANLHKRNALPTGVSVNCVLCSSSKETKKSSVVWLSLLPRDLVKLLLLDRRSEGGTSWLQTTLLWIDWWSVWVSVIWTIRSLRNAIIFKSDVVDFETAVDEFKYRAWNWCKAMVKGFHLSLYVWKIDLLNCLKQLP